MNKIHSIKIEDTAYPHLLREIYNSPKKLYYKGDLEVLEKTCISIVGTRKYSEYGELMTEKIVEELAVIDVAIVSGLAKGIDTIAHKAALKNGLKTIAVLGSGLDNIYPKQNIKLAEKIEQNGLILSEYEPTAEPLDFHFPQRNRIVSGLSVASIVVEAPEKSGALITAKLALDQGREIFAVPGDIDRENSIGALRLIQHSGAYPISSGQDVIEVLKKQPYLFEVQVSEPETSSSTPRKSKPKQSPIKAKSITSYKLTPEESEILSIIPARRSFNVDEILSKTSISPRNILSALSLLEIKELIVTKDGKYLRKC